MKRIIQLHHLLLATTIAGLASGCPLKLDSLDAGVDDDGSSDEGGAQLEADECLVGTEIDAVGVQQSSMDPGCEVTCAKGWGHDGEQLEIAWTVGKDSFPIAPAIPRALGLLANGRLVVARHIPGAINLTFLEPDGLNIGGYDVDGIGEDVYGVEIASHVLYVAHGNHDNTVRLTAVDIDSQQKLWERDFFGTWADEPARGGGKIAFVVKDDSISGEPIGDLVVMDLDGELLWTEPVDGNGGFGVAFSPDNAKLAVTGETTRVYAADDGALLDEFVHAALPIIYSQKLAFADENRVITVGAGLEYERFEGWLAGDSLTGGSPWEQVYNRADAWCPDALDDQWTAATAEWLGKVVKLADGNLVVLGSESFEQIPNEPDPNDPQVSGTQPWVARISADGALLASDRGLWDGSPSDVVADPDGSFYVLFLVEQEDNESPGFRVRKYLQ